MKTLFLVFVLSHVSEAHKIKVIDMPLIDLVSGTLLKPARVWGEIQKPDNVWVSDSNYTLSTMPSEWLFLLETPLQHIPIFNGSVDVDMVKEAYEMVNGKQKWYYWQELWIEYAVKCLYEKLEHNENKNITYLESISANSSNMSTEEEEEIYRQNCDDILKRDHKHNEWGRKKGHNKTAHSNKQSDYVHDKQNDTLDSDNTQNDQEKGSNKTKKEDIYSDNAKKDKHEETESDQFQDYNLVDAETEQIFENPDTEAISILTTTILTNHSISNNTTD